MKNIKELLQLMLDLFNTDRRLHGLCHAIGVLYSRDKITGNEYDIILSYIRNNRPSKWSSIKAYKNRDSQFYWEVLDKEPRIKWLKKHIKLNS